MVLFCFFGLILFNRYIYMYICIYRYIFKLKKKRRIETGMTREKLISGMNRMNEYAGQWVTYHHIVQLARQAWRQTRAFHARLGPSLARGRVVSNKAWRRSSRVRVREADRTAERDARRQGETGTRAGERAGGSGLSRGGEHDRLRMTRRRRWNELRRHVTRASSSSSLGVYFPTACERDVSQSRMKKRRSEGNQTDE